MNADIMAEWFRRQGYNVVRTASSYWYNAGLGVFQAFPYHWLIEPTRNELEGLFHNNGAIALRYSLPMNGREGMASYHVVCEDRHFDLSSLRRQARQGVQRGLAYASFERIPISRLATDGWRLRQDTLERQGRSGAETQEWWNRLCLSVEDLPGFECFGAVRNGELIAAFLGFRCDDWFTLPYEQSSSAHLESRVNNALFYTMTREALKETGISRVFFCVQSLDAPASVDGFKIRMGYTAKPVRQRVVFHPYLSPLANNLFHHFLKKAVRYNPSNYRFAKAEGIFRFYLQGRLPLAKQQWPECLEEVKEALLAAQSPVSDSRRLEQDNSVQRTGML
jgi:hypothetical protein